MAWINNSNFTIRQAWNGKHDSEGYFEVDDLIAFPVAEMNRRGYRTIASCAGHPFLTENIIDTPLPKHGGTANQINDMCEDAIVKFYTFADQRSYVAFEEPIPFDIEPPEGWRYDTVNCALYCHYCQNTPNPYKFTKLQVKSMENLTRWAYRLPQK